LTGAFVGDLAGSILIGALCGLFVGTLIGLLNGALVGEALVGAFNGACVGDLAGSVLMGAITGLFVGAFMGLLTGTLVGEALVGAFTGARVGDLAGSREKEVFIAYRFALQYYRSKVSSRSELLSTLVTKFGDPRGAASTFPVCPFRIPHSAPHGDLAPPMPRWLWT
jgi:hypothetical protein